MKRHSRQLGAALLAGAALVGGCQARRAFVPPALPPVPLAQAVGIVDANIARATGTLRAVGTVDGYFTMDGRRRNYSVDAVFFFLRPNHVRFDLKKFGDRQFLFGSNAEMYWFYDKQSGEYYCGRHDEPDDYPADMPIRPHQIADALALRPIGDIQLHGLAAPDPATRSQEFVARREGHGGDALGHATHVSDRATLMNTVLRTDGDSAVGVVQRVVDDYQQILFIVTGAGGRSVLEKEYWLDRHVPQVVRRVLFRDAEGLVELESRLDNYRMVEGDGPMLPHVMLADWPEHGARMRFRVSRWTLVPQVGPGGPQFATPRECRP